MIKAVIFDVFGVIYPDVGLDWFNNHVQDPTRLPEFKSAAAKVDIGEMSRDTQFGIWSDLSGIPKDEIGQQVDAALIMNDPLIERIVKPLAKTARRAILTNANRDWLRQPLRRDGIGRNFDEIVISAEVGAVKPDQKIFDITLGRLGVAATEAVFIDDSAGNVEAAARMGITAIQYNGIDALEERMRSLQLLQ